MLNKVQLIGNLGKDPEVRMMNNGEKVVSFSLATAEKWKDKTTGEKKEAAEWHNVVCFNQGIVKLCQYLNKGDTVYVEGKLKTRSYDKDGEKRYITEIVIDRFGGDLKILKQNKQSSSEQQIGYAKTTDAFANPELNDDIPF